MRRHSNSDLSWKISLKGTFQSDGIEQYGRRDNVSTSGATGESGQGVCQKVDVARKTGVAEANENISVCHRLPIRKQGPKTIIAEFVRRQMKQNMMANKKSTEPGKMNINDNVTLLRGKIYLLLQKLDVAKSISEKEKNKCVYE